MKKINILAVAGLMAAPFTPALAGSLDAPAVEPYVAPVVVAQAPATGGDWTGGYAGVQLGYGDVGSSGNVLDGNGVIGGLHAGYDYDFGSYVVGGEVDWDKADTDLGNGAGKLDSVARLKLRGGIDLGRTLVYGTAGVAQAKATVAGASLTDTGPFGGVGVDYALTDRWTVGGEVLVHKFDNFDGSGIDLDATTATARASFRF